MPRNPNNKNEFIAGKLPVVTYNGKQYNVDGRLQELRNVDDFMDKISAKEFFPTTKDMSTDDIQIVLYEFFGVNQRLKV